MSEWISINEHLPEIGQWSLLVWRGHVRYGYRREKRPKQRGGEWVMDGNYYEGVTHWMPLPEPPEAQP